MDRETFDRSVREVVRHLHNRAYLAAHPLTAALSAERRPLSAEALRRRIIAAIEELKPVGDENFTDREWRQYQHMVLRVLKGHSVEQVARTLGVSLRQASRDYAEAVAELCALLWPPIDEQATGSGQVPPDGGQSATGASPGRDLPTEAAMLAEEQPTTSIADTLQGVVATLQDLAHSSEATYEISVADTLPAVAASRSLLRQALLHVLMYVAAAAPDRRVRITASDSAQGITVQFLTKASHPKPVSRAVSQDPTVAPQLLAAARQILEMLSASLELRGSNDQPAITLVLPPVPLHPVLVIDDNPDVVGLFRRYLRGEPYRLLQANSGDSALRLATELQPKVIILDVLLPSEDGWDILRRLRTLPILRDVPVVICSVLPERTLALSLAVTDFLPKPVTRPALLALLERYCSAPTGHPAPC